MSCILFDGSCIVVDDIVVMTSGVKLRTEKFKHTKSRFVGYVGDAVYGDKESEKALVGTLDQVRRTKFKKVVDGTELLVLDFEEKYMLYISNNEPYKMPLQPTAIGAYSEVATMLLNSPSLREELKLNEVTGAEENLSVAYRVYKYIKIIDASSENPNKYLGNPIEFEFGAVKG